MDRIQSSDHVFYFMELFGKITEAFSHVSEYDQEEDLNRKTHLKIWGLPSDSLKQDWETYMPLIKGHSGILFAQLFFL